MKNNLKIISVALITLAYMAPAPARADKDELLGLYSLAIEKAYAIGRATARRNASMADTDIAMAQLLPRVDANAGINWINHSTLYYNPTVHAGSYTGDNYGVGVRIPVFQMASLFELAASKASARAAEAYLSGSRQEMMILLVQTYFNLLKAQSEEQLYRDELQRRSNILAQVKIFMESGAGDIIAVYDANARLENAAADLLKARTQRRMVASQMSAIVGREVTAVRDLVPDIAHHNEPRHMEWWLNIMQKQHPALVQAGETLKQTELQRKAASAGHLPVVSASGGYTVSKGSTFLPEVETRQWYAGFSISLPLYAGGETAAKVRRAFEAEAEQGYVLSAFREQAVQKLHQAYVYLEQSDAMIEVQRKKMASVEMQLTAVKLGFENGTRTIVDLWNAEQAHAVARHDLINARYDYEVRSLELKFAAGILEDVDLASVNNKLGKQ